MIHALFLMIAFFIYIQSLNGGPTYLIWNMTLALISYDAAVLTLLFKKQKWSILFFLLWLLSSSPTLFYMITDLVHMTWVADVLSKPSVFLLFLALFPVFYSGFSVVWRVGMSSRSVGNLISIWIHCWRQLCRLCPVWAIYIGRYDRLNSWDLLLHPQLVVEKLLQTLSLIVCLSFLVLLFAVYEFSISDER